VALFKPQLIFGAIQFIKSLQFIITILIIPGSSRSMFLNSLAEKIKAVL